VKHFTWVEDTDGHHGNKKNKETEL